MTRSNFVFVASEAAISPVNVELQLQVKHQNGPVTQYSYQEASNNYVLPTNMDELSIVPLILIVLNGIILFMLKMLSWPVLPQ